MLIREKIVGNHWAEIPPLKDWSLQKEHYFNALLQV